MTTMRVSAAMAVAVLAALSALSVLSFLAYLYVLNAGSKSDQNSPNSSVSLAEHRDLYSVGELKNIFEEMTEREIRRNNHLGCNDMQFLAPYFRAILYRRVWSQGSGNIARTVIVDVGANTGDDTVSITKSFHPILQMCNGFSSPILLVGVEPSPKVFCEMIDIVSTKLTEEDNRGHILLNVALSNNTGHLIFKDPGNEGGQVIGSDFTELQPMTTDELMAFGQCKYANGEFKHMAIDRNRRSTVPTYTLDLLVSSLEGLKKINQGEEIFAVKIDTEGHDYNVLLGAKALLKNKRITFIVFEVWSNHYVKLVSRHMAHYDYQCFVLLKDTLVPVHEKDWWYPHMDNFTMGYWGNGLCGVKGSKDMKMLWRMYHSDNLKLLNSYNLL